MEENNDYVSVCVFKWQFLYCFVNNIKKKISSVIVFNYFYEEKPETIAVEFYVVLIFSEGNVLVHSINTCELKIQK